MRVCRDVEAFVWPAPEDASTPIRSVVVTILTIIIAVSILNDLVGAIS